MTAAFIKSVVFEDVRKCLDRLIPNSHQQHVCYYDSMVMEVIHIMHVLKILEYSMSANDIPCHSMACYTIVCNKCHLIPCDTQTFVDSIQNHTIHNTSKIIIVHSLWNLAWFWAALLQNRQLNCNAVNFNSQSCLGLHEILRGHHEVHVYDVASLNSGGIDKVQRHSNVNHGIIYACLRIN